MAGPGANPQLPTQRPAEAAKEADVTVNREKYFPKVALWLIGLQFREQEVKWSKRACQQYPTVLRPSPLLPLNCLVVEKGLFSEVPNVNASRGKNRAITRYLKILHLNKTKLVQSCNKNRLKQIGLGGLQVRKDCFNFQES